jgi:hypothetical protein
MRTYTLATGCIFGVLALAHAARLFLDWHIQVAGWVVPMWISWLAIVVAGGLCVWAFRIASRTSSSGT